MGNLIRTDGTVSEYPPKGKKYTLAELQAAVGGDITLIPLPDWSMLVVNEDGRRLNLPVNAGASAQLGRGAVPIVGDAVLCRRREID